MSFQSSVNDWLVKCFADHPEALALPERAQRLVRKVAELVQAANMPEEHLHAIIHRVYSCEAPDDIKRAAGAVSVTHAAFCTAAGVSLETCAWKELTHCHAETDRIRARYTQAHSTMPETPAASIHTPPPDAVYQQALEDEAWNLYCDATQNNPHAYQSWAQMPGSVKAEYIQRAARNVPAPTPPTA